MDSSLNGLLLLHFARTASNLTVFNSFIIWNSNFFFFFIAITKFRRGDPEHKEVENQGSCPTYKQPKNIYNKAGFPWWFEYFRGCQTLWILPHHSSRFTKKCKKMLFTTSGQTSLKILRSSLVKVICQSKVLGCLCLNLLKPFWNKEEILFQWKPESSSPSRKKKKSVSALCCYLDSSGTELILGRLYNLSVLSREVLPSAVSVVQYLQSSELEEISSPFHISIHQRTPKTN